MSRASPITYRILLVGDDGVGKTSFAYRFGYGAFIEDVQGLALEDMYSKTVTVDGTCVQATVLDTWWFQYGVTRPDVLDDIIRVGDAFIHIYSVTRRDTYEDTVNHYKKVRQVKQEPMAICALVGNKSDLTHEERKVSTEDGIALARRLDCVFFEVSALTGENVDLVVRALVQNLLLRHLDDEAKQEDCCSLSGLVKLLCCA